MSVYKLDGYTCHHGMHDSGCSLGGMAFFRQKGGGEAVTDQTPQSASEIREVMRNEVDALRAEVLRLRSEVKSYRKALEAIKCNEGEGLCDCKGTYCPEFNAKAALSGPGERG